MTTPKCFFVLGMHRSGTSMITEILHRCGLSVGPYEELVPPMAKSNPRGHWEPRELVAINDQILAENGAKWDTVTCADIPLERELPPQLEARIASYVTLWEQRGESWVWKDPRLCLTAHYWREILGDSYAGAFIVLRTPSAISASLVVRDGIDEGRARELIDAYSKARYWGDFSMRRQLWLVYEEFFAGWVSRFDPVKEIHRVLGPVLGVSIDTVRGAVKHCVRPELRHH